METEILDTQINLGVKDPAQWRYSHLKAIMSSATTTLEQWLLLATDCDV